MRFPVDRLLLTHSGHSYILALNGKHRVSSQLAIGAYWALYRWYERFIKLAPQ